ncbi:MAG: TonB-dependent receptor [Chitinophagaceae bacterium]|nr:TonB-dependent receptor [Chitinophagaceae bacterium]
MRLAILLMVAASFQASARGYGQNISLSIKDAPLEKTLRQIKAQSGYHIAYLKEWMQSTKNVTLSLRDVPLQQALDACFKEQPLTYTIIERTIVVKPRPAPSTGRENSIPILPARMTVHGAVTNESGVPLAGVSVTIKNKAKAAGVETFGTTTDSTGAFVINAGVGDVLVFSFVDYLPQEVRVGNNTNITISLIRSNKSLEDVVVVGYGTQKKVNLTGAVATVESDKLENRPNINLGDALVGLVPNLNVNLTSGQPGASASFNIRGYTTISGGSSAPLILVDGVQRDPNLIDPNNVESVTVLKDAASAAIYGGRAAYGVILITTRNAKKGSKPRISYTGSYTTSRPTNLPDYVNSDGYIKLFNSAQRTGTATGGYTSTDPLTQLDSTMAAAYRNDPAHNPNVYPDPGNPKAYRYVGNTDWVKVLYPGWAPQQQHFVSVSGGEGRTTYSGNMGYFRQEGLEKVAHQIYQRYTPNLKINSDVTNWLTLNLSMSMTHTDNNGGAGTRIGQGGPTNGSWIPGDLRPLQPVYHPDGHFSGQGSYTNPIAVLTLSGRDIDYQNDFWTTGRAIIKPIQHVTITSDFTWNGFSDFDKANLIPFNEYGVGGVFLDIFPWTNPSQVRETKKNNNYNALNAYITYENTFSGKHYVKALAGYNQEYQHYQIGTALARNLIDPNLPAIGVNNDSKPSVGGTETEYALVGSFFRLNYIFDKRYLLEVNGRYDGTSRFQPNKRYVFSPSVSAGWNLAEESFMEHLKGSINELKLRGSYGVLPNQLAPPNVVSSGAQYPYIATMPTSTVSYLFNDQPGITVGTPALISSGFTWEKVQTTNIGLDYAFLNGRLSGSFDYFITYTKDMLVASQQLPAVLGASAPATNSADLRTKGWEWSVTWKDKLLNGQLFYSATLGLSDNSSTITRYNGNPTGSINDHYPGEKLGAIWGFQTAGFYQTDAEAALVDNSALAGYTWGAGDIKYADLNHDGKINYGASTLSDPGDRKIIGNKTPRYKIGLNLNLSYKGFDFAAFMQGVLKAQYDPTYSNVFNPFPYHEWGIPYKYAMNYWTPENPSAYFARPRFAGGGNEQPQTKFLQNAAFVRVKQLTLGYTLPGTLLKNWKLSQIRAYITGANLITFTSLFKGFDPEIINYQGGFQTYPINKSVSFGLQVTL